MGDFTGFFRRNVWSTWVALGGAVIVALGAVNDAVSFFTATWLPTWAPEVLGVVLFYVGFLMVAAKADKTAQSLKKQVEALEANRTPQIIIDAPLDAEPHYGPAGTPNMTYREFTRYMQGSTWVRQNPDRSVVQELCDKLHLRSLGSWGRREHDGRVERVDPRLWSAMTIDDGGEAITEGNEIVFYDIQLDRHQVQLTWAHREGWMA
jgi:hypothetical protein